MFPEPTLKGPTRTRESGDKHMEARELGSRRKGWWGLSPVSLDLSKSRNEPHGLKQFLSTSLQTMLPFKAKPLIHTDSLRWN